METRAERINNVTVVRYVGPAVHRTVRTLDLELKTKRFAAFITYTCIAVGIAVRAWWAAAWLHAANIHWSHRSPIITIHIHHSPFTGWNHDHDAYSQAGWSAHTMYVRT